MRLVQSIPPYENFVPARLELRPELGTVYAIQMQLADDPGTAVDAALDLMVNATTASLVIFCPNAAPTDDIIRLAYSAAPAGIPVLHGSSPAAEQLRNQFTDPEIITRAVNALLSRTRPSAPESLIRHYGVILQNELCRTNGIVRAVAVGQMTDPVSGSQYVGLGPPARRIQRYCFAADLPVPRVWRSWCRACSAIITAQRYPAVTLTVIALELGYADAAGLYALLRKWGLRKPGGVRQTVGWWWLLKPLLQPDEACRSAEQRRNT